MALRTAVVPKSPANIISRFLFIYIKFWFFYEAKDVPFLNCKYQSYQILRLKRMHFTVQSDFLTVRSDIIA